jgi:hypothetical protein
MGVTSIELTFGTKTLVFAFFVVDVEGNYSVFLGKDWIHTNHYVPSTLHQMLVQWVGDETETVQGDVSACIAMGDAPALWTYDTAKCLTGVKFSNYQFISVCREGFTPITLELTENQLNHM